MPTTFSVADVIGEGEFEVRVFPEPADRLRWVTPILTLNLSEPPADGVRFEYDGSVWQLRSGHNREGVAIWLADEVVEQQ